MLGAGLRAANALKVGADLVRREMGSISAGTLALGVGVFIGSQIPIGPGGYVASLTTDLASAVGESERPPELSAPTTSFQERFFGAVVSPRSVSVRIVETEEGAGTSVHVVLPV